MGVSGRELARQLEVSEKAVRKADAAGRIKKTADGGYDVEECRRLWAAGADPARTKVRTEVRSEVRNVAPQQVAVRTEDDAKRQREHDCFASKQG